MKPKRSAKRSAKRDFGAVAKSKHRDRRNLASRKPPSCLGTHPAGVPCRAVKKLRMATAPPNPRHRTHRNDSRATITPTIRQTQKFAPNTSAAEYTLPDTTMTRQSGSKSAGRIFAWETLSACTAMKACLQVRRRQTWPGQFLTLSLIFAFAFRHRHCGDLGGRERLLRRDEKSGWRDESQIPTCRARAHRISDFI